jgi:integrase
MLVDGDAIDIADFTRDFAGNAVDLRPIKWSLNIAHRSASLDWSRLDGCDRDAVSALRLHIVRLIETRSGSHVVNTFEAVTKYLISMREALEDPLAIGSLLSYLAQLRGKRDGSPFHLVRYWYVQSADRGLAGFNDEIVFALQDLRIEGNAKGVAVLSSDPNGGPLSEFEEEALRSALIRDKGPLQERLALWLAFAYGTNPANLALLREEDFITYQFGDAAPAEHFLNIPRIKKRTKARADFKKRYVSAQLAAIIKELVDLNRSRFPKDTVRPLFRRSKASKSLAKGPISEYACHLKSHEITGLISRCARRLCVLSPKTGLPIALSTRRLRYTFACKMVRQGVGARELAELLDHTDLQNIQVYYKADSRMVERLDVTIAKHLGPTISAFMGEIVSSAGKAIDLIPYRDLPDLGQCGASFVCGLSAPKNCYTCAQFRAFNDGPHKAVLDSLIAERTQLLNAGHERIAEQLDRTILAAGEVVARISGDLA